MGSQIRGTSVGPFNKGILLVRVCIWGSPIFVNSRLGQASLILNLQLSCRTQVRNFEGSQHSSVVSFLLRPFISYSARLVGTQKKTNPKP